MMLPTSRLGSKMARAGVKLMTSRLFKPLMMRMMTDTDDYELPTY
jgi:hypothetical protein